MPCTYYTPEEISRQNYEESQKLKAELDKTTRLLCEVMTGLENEGWSPEEVADITKDSPDLQAWWAEHKKLDEARKAEEAARLKRVEDLKAKVKAEEEAAERRIYEKLKKKYG